MHENLIPASAGDDGGPGAVLRLVSLAPSFDSKQHQIYFELLERALNHGSTHNVALTGAYGTGKSSVLEQLKVEEQFKGRVVGLSLSTISPSVTSAELSDSDQDGVAARTRVNQIQKEIVKQLLYRMPPSDVPQSRFRRATIPDRPRDLSISVAIGFGIAIVLIGLGVLHPQISLLFADEWRQVLAYGVVTSLLVGVTWVVRAVIREGPLLFSASVNTPVTTVTLSKQSGTYFDEYLDEIVYFFQATNRDIVVIEDIDRFEDAAVFDTLRALNGLLNSSGQVGRRVVFVYAIRDSVFEGIGTHGFETLDGVLDFSDTDHAKRALKRASRTKFFDVIIPIVPFVSADNARDLMSEAMKSPEFKIDPGLIRLAARHVADMRMIHNIRNEFEIYRNRLISSKTRIPGITHKLLFAIVLYKNTHLSDFEKIRHRDSALDHLFSAWRVMVRENLAVESNQMASLREARYNDDRIAIRAGDLARRLSTLRDDLLDSAPQTKSISFPDEIEGELGSPQVWTRIAAQDGLEMSFNHRDGTTSSFNFSLDALARLLGVSIDPARWQALDRAALSEAEIQCEEKVNFLRHHNWSDLCARTEFVVQKISLPLTADERVRLDAVSESDFVNFGDLVAALFASELSRELVRDGYLTSHFAQYASSYYGKHLGPNAREFLHRCIEPGLADSTFALDKKDVIQILREQGADKSDTADLFSDVSVLNVSVLDYLLEVRPGAASTVAVQLSRVSEGSTDFLDTYMSQGKLPALLLAALAPHWSGIVDYAATSAAVLADSRIHSVNAVLSSLVNASVELSSEASRFMSSQYPSLEAITDPINETRSALVLGVLKSAGGSIESLESLNELARHTAVQLKLFPITEENLRVLEPHGVIALDKLRQTPVYEQVLEELDTYLRLVEHDPSTFATVLEPSNITLILRDVANFGSEVVGRLLSCSRLDARVAAITDVPRDAWTGLITSGRTEPTFRNAEAYIERFGVDETLAILLKGRRIMESEAASEEARHEVAYALLEAQKAIPSTLARVQLVASLKTGFLSLARITPESGDLIARLLKYHLLDDTAEVFSEALMIDWPTRESTIKVSKNFASAVTPLILPAAHLPAFLRSSAISLDKKRSVLKNLPSYLAVATKPMIRQIVVALISERWRLTLVNITALREAGALQGQIISLLALKKEGLAKDDLKLMLRLLGGDYKRVADGGRGRPNFVDNEAHREVLDRLAGDTIRRVEPTQFKSRGSRLVAHLM